MGTRAWLVVLLALTLSCEGPQIGEPRAETPAGSAGADTGAGADADAGTDAGGSGGAGVAPDPCSAGPLSAPIPNCDPIPAASTGDIHADCVARINQFRWECQCLPPLQRWTDGEACTDSNAEYDSVNGVHASFQSTPCGSGARAQNECPGWPSVDHVITGCLRDMWDEGPEDGNPDTVNGHYETMATTTYTRVACGFYTTPSGEVWGVQNFD
ncbi:MAG: hypothetical protein JSV06_01765 [Myxococcales bacterium]|nr:MAG: hypothetical protein JSV06_01765 [Myxococcales bacterium]